MSAPYSIPALTQLGIAKGISPGVFKNKTPKFHIDVIDFLDRPTDQKVIILPRGFGKSTIFNKIEAFNRAWLYEKKFIIIVP